MRMMHNFFRIGGVAVDLPKFFYGKKKSFISIILKEQKENKENRGSVEFQVVSFTNKIQRLTSHLVLHKKDYLSHRGLLKIMGP
ncbi:putative ribosomal protein S15 [Helianthus annuus]|nr:putative ribosomal protein S15 [Helianthus annuus]